MERCRREELPPKSTDDDTAMSETLLDLDEILDTIARAMNSKNSHAKPGSRPFTCRPGEALLCWPERNGRAERASSSILLQTL